MDPGERGGDVLAQRPVDVADEAQGEVELVVVLPACARHAGHGAGKLAADLGRRAERYEQAVHG